LPGGKIKAKKETENVTPLCLYARLSPRQGTNTSERKLP